ncbi:DEAD/DEAH box helicase family protein [Persicimonas caeni]|nr:DEAD/DEAH box helicase family protein [Persicimonas caeni]
MTDAYARYDLTKSVSPTKHPVEHQREALDALQRWYDGKRDDAAGALLSIPTGGGKTFIATRFLARTALREGRKVLWLAHTHHLLEQAFEAFGEGVQAIGEERQVSVRTVSGAPGHFRIGHVEPGDDVVIATIQTITGAYKRGVDALEEFIDAAGDDLFVVFDEAHHTPANTYRRLLLALRDRIPRMQLLGMSATPTYTDEGKRGWLGELFPQGIIYRVTADDLMAARVLAQPKIHDIPLDFTPTFDATDYERWSRTNRDLPESIITQLAENRERNAHIADHYAQNRALYGQTIIFADRWPQCIMLEEMLEDRGVRAGSVFSHTDPRGRTAEERNKTRHSNDQVIEAFKNGELDVVVNIGILTEGTDVPDAKTVFLTRKTTSSILLTQMVGRALRGPRFGGTDEAHIVSFIDDWRQLIHWADVEDIFGGLETGGDPAERTPIEQISVALVRRLARQMDTGININPVPYTELLPVGWYRVEYEVRADHDNIEQVRRMLLVYEDQKEIFDGLLEEWTRDLPQVFVDELLSEDVDRVEERIASHVDQWAERFGDAPEELMSNIRPNLRALARHMAQGDGRRPEFFPFEARDQHDLDVLAQHVYQERLDRIEEEDLLRREYGQADRYWKRFYPSFEHFCSAFDASYRRLRSDTPPTEINKTVVAPPPPELTEEEKDEIINRARGRCLCCDWDYRPSLEIDHIRPYSDGGSTSRQNSQTLCKRCNQVKGTDFINFRVHATPWNEAPTSELRLDAYPPNIRDHAMDPKWWSCYFARVINFFYESDAVDRVEVGQRGEALRVWKIHLFSNNPSEWLEPRLPKLVEKARQIRADHKLKAAPKRIEVYVQGERVVSASSDAGETVASPVT